MPSSSREKRYDCGSKLGTCSATVEYGLKHPSLGDAVGELDFAAGTLADSSRGHRISTASADSGRRRRASMRPCRASASRRCAISCRCARPCAAPASRCRTCRCPAWGHFARRDAAAMGREYVDHLLEAGHRRVNQIIGEMHHESALPTTGRAHRTAWPNPKAPIGGYKRTTPSSAECCEGYRAIPASPARAAPPRVPDCCRSDLRWLVWSCP